MADLTGAPSPQEAAQKLLDQVPQLIPGVPNSAWVPVLFGQIRGAGGILAGMGFAWGKYVSGEEFTMVFWGGLAVVMLGWSGWQKIKTEITKYRLAATSAVTSAAATANNTPADVAPVPVAVTPAGIKTL